MGTTSNRSYPYPAGSDAVDVPGDIQALADDVDTDMAAVIAYDTAYAAKSSAYTLLGTDRLVDVTGTTTVTLPAAASHTGRVYTIRNTGSDTVTVSGVTSLALAGKGSATVVSDGSAWTVVDATYTDESVGRRIFTWDAVNARWQMTYGDTGWRRINADIDALSTVTGNVDVRRVNDQVSVRVSNFKDTNTTPLRVNLLSTNLDVGFRPGAAIYATIPYDSATFGTYRNFYVATTGVVQFGGPTQAGGFWGQFGFSVDAAWPTSLPGTAVGSIPS